MKAMILNASKPVEEHPLELCDVPVPEPDTDEVLIKVSACGVCYTDLHTVEGELTLPKLPVIPGHQMVGKVEAVGELVNELKAGDRVGVTWLYGACGECDYCAGGLENLCDSAMFTGLHRDGGYAEYAVAKAAHAHRLPRAFDDLQAAPLLCAGIIGYRSLCLSGIGPGGRLGLYGFGASAHIAIQIARHWGCDVYVFTRGEDHRAQAEELGAVWTGDARDEPPERMDASITFAPAGWLVPEALRVLRKGGTLAINAIHMSPIPEFDYDLLWGERTVRSVANLTRTDAREFLALASEIPIETDVEVHPLEGANEVLAKVKRAEVQGAAVLKV